MTIPAWAGAFLGARIVGDGAIMTINGQTLVRDGDILRAQATASRSQAQTSETFGFKWHQRETYENTLAAAMRAWLIERYGDVSTAPFWREYAAEPILLDAGCGSGFSALELWGPVLPKIRYVGADISDAVDVAQVRFRERGLEGVFIQADLQRLPIGRQSVDLIFSEGVFHHCDDTRTALTAAVSHLKPGGRIFFYVYKKKGPIREFTDDYIRERLQGLSPAQAWEALMPLSELGKCLGELGIEIDLPEEIKLLDIPAGKIDLQRLFYWHIFKAFYRADLSLEEMHHINFDWYAPRNAHRQTPEEVRAWCAELGLTIEREQIQDAGITVIARKAA